MQAFPVMTHLFRPSENAKINFRRIVTLLKPKYAEEGTNERLYQKKVYNLFVKYLREAGSK